MQKYYILILLLFSNLILAKSNFTISDIDTRITNHTYNLEIDVADSLIQEEINKYPNSPKYYLLQVGNELMRTTVLVEAAATERKQIVKDSMNTVTLNFTQSIVDKFEDIEMTIENKFYMGGLYGYLGRFYGMEKSWMSAFSDGKKAKNLLEEVIEEDPEFYDAYISLGMFYYYGDRMGGVMGFIASILGFSGDRAKGIEYMKISAEKGVLTSAQATMLLAELYCRLEDNDFISVKYFNDFVSKYPKNYHIKNWFIREALNINMAFYVKNIVESDPHNIVNALSKAEYYHKIGEYQISINYFNEFEKQRNNYWRYYQRGANFSNAINYWMLSDSVKAFENYDTFNQTQRDILQDLILAPQDYKSFFKFAALVAKNNETIQISNFIKSRTPSSIVRIESLYLFEIGRFYFFQNDYKNAEKYFLEAKDINPEWLNYAAAKYLIDTYLQFDADIEAVENLIDLIDDLDSQKLEWSAKDLENKYNL